jgi:hypothetical protein
MISREFDSDEIFRLVELIRNGGVDVPQHATQIEFEIDPTIFSIRGRDIEITFSRKLLSALFMSQFLFYHVFIVAIFFFLTNEIVFLIQNFYSNSILTLLAIYASLSTFS